MPPNRERRPQLTVLDRLLDDDPKNRQEEYVTRAQTVRKLMQAVRRDLEWLLNTRAFAEETGEGHEQTRSSVFAYGLPDFSSYPACSDETCLRLERALIRALEIFEPRLFNVTVAIDRQNKEERGLLRLVISGWLRMDPAPLPVSFDTRLELSRGEYRVAGE